MQAKRRIRCRMTPRAWRRIACASLFGAVIPRHALGITTRDDVPDSSYTAYSAESQFAATGYVKVNGGQVFGSGTLIAPNWVLTAAHVVTQDTTGYPAFSPASIVFGQGAGIGGSTDAVVQVDVESGWSYNLGAGNDLALLELASPITNTTPAMLYSSTLGTELGQTASIVGYGKAGTGLTGATLGAGTRRAMTNVIDSFGGQLAGGVPAIGISPNIMFTDFDQPGNPLSSIMGDSTPTSLEGAAAPGDSGGSVYLTVGGQTYIAGVTDFLGAMPTNLISPNPNGYYGDYNGYTRIAVSQTMNFLDPFLQPSSSWAGSGGGSWASAANWANSSIPEFTGAVAAFTSSTLTPSTVTLDGNWTVGGVTFNNSNTYTVASGSWGSLVLDNGGASATATVTDSGGTQCVNAPIVLNSNVLINVVNAGDTLKLWGNISGTGGVTMSGSGAVTVSGANSYAGPTTINSGTYNVSSNAALPFGGVVVNNSALNINATATAGSITGSGWVTVGTSSTPATLHLANGGGQSSQSGLTIISGSTLDIGNNSLAINYTGASPVASIAAALASGYNSGTWTGTGINSSAAAADPGKFTIGYADGNVDTLSTAQPNQVLVQYTIPGDADLTGTVNFWDFVIVLKNFDKTGNDWANGNFTYDPQGYVGFADLAIVLSHFNQSIVPSNNVTADASMSAVATQAVGPQTQLITSSLPEPGAASLAAAAAVCLLTSRRRKTANFASKA